MKAEARDEAYTSLCDLIHSYGIGLAEAYGKLASTLRGMGRDEEALAIEDALYVLSREGWAGTTWSAFLVRDLRRVQYSRVAADRSDDVL